MRQCVLPVERGGVEGCEGEAEAEEVLITIVIIIVLFTFNTIVIIFNINSYRIATVMNVLNGTLGRSGHSAGSGLGSNHMIIIV